MRILLINPFYPISETPSPPLGLAYIAAALERAGHTVAMRDSVVTPYSRAILSRQIRRLRPGMVGVTAVTMNIDRAMAVVADVKSVDRGIFTVAGGPHATFRAETTLAENPDLDAVVRGEGEETVVELAAALEAGAPLDAVAGLVFRQGTGTVRTANRAPIADMDRLPPPARHLIPLGRYRTLQLPVSMTTSRGCPFQCIFCAGRKMAGARVRYRDPARVVDEMAALARLDFKQINIADDLFTASRRHCLSICDEIMRRGLRVSWTSFARVDTISVEILTRMRAAGCTGISFGVESGNPGILETVRKGITVKQVIDAAAMCQQAGMTAFASFILGLPGETPETLEETLAFADRLKQMGVPSGFHLLAPFPGTEIRDRCDRFGIRILTDDWSAYHANRAIVETASVTAGMLDDIVIGWEQDYNAYLGDIARRRAEGRISEAEAAPLVNLERTVALYDMMMESAVENHGRWDGAEAAGDAADMLSILARRIGRVGQTSESNLRDALAWALSTGGLRNAGPNGRVRWEWVDDLC